MIVNTAVSAERTVVATLVCAATTGNTATIDAILESVTAADFADQACEQVFIVVKQLVESRAPVSRAAVEAADAPPGIPGDVDRAAVLDTAPLTDEQQLNSTIGAVVRAAGLRHARVGLEDVAAGIQEAASDPGIALDTIARDLVTVSEHLGAAQVRATGDQGPVTLADELDVIVEGLQRTHGKEFLGLPTRTLPTLDKYTLGVRGFILLAAEPGVGKTSLGMEIGFDIVEQNAEAAFIFFSFEMCRRDLQHRLLAMVSELHWRTIVLGSPGVAKSFGGIGLAFNPEDMSAFQNAVAALKNLGKRLFIHDLESMPEAGYEAMLGAIRKAKKLAGVERAFVLVDSLQATPFVGPQGTRWANDIERDNHVINRMLALQRATGDALLLISEQNKEGLGRATLKSTRGTARAVYSPDCVFILQRPDKYQPDPEAIESRVNLRIIKGRDGTLRGTIPLIFHHVTCTFTEADEVAGPDPHGTPTVSV